MIIRHNNPEGTGIAIPSNRFEAEMLAKKILDQLSFIESCIDDAIAYCVAQECRLQNAA